MATESENTIDTNRYPFSFRLMFRFEGTRISLSSARRIRKFKPSQAGPRPRGGENSGTWLELLDDSEKVRFFIRLRDPFATLAEVHLPDKTTKVVHRPPPKEGSFHVLVPDIPHARRCRIWASSLKDPRQVNLAEPVGEFVIEPDQDGDDGGVLR